MPRSATIDRQTAETQIHLTLSLDGSGRGDIATSVPFLDHMLVLLARHGFFDLEVRAEGDVQVDSHHTVEDLGICLGEAFKKAIGDKQGLRRYGRCTMPMHEALATVDIDFSGRPHLVFNLDLPKAKVGDFDVECASEFWLGFARNVPATLHFVQFAGENTHHILEACFKGAGHALAAAVKIDAAHRDEIPSTKGLLV